MACEPPDQTDPPRPPEPARGRGETGEHAEQLGAVTRAQAPDAPVAGAQVAGEQAERFGPVTVARYVKEDGRSLILYSRVADDAGARPAR